MEIKHTPEERLLMEIFPGYDPEKAMAKKLAKIPQEVRDEFTRLCYKKDDFTEKEKDSFFAFLRKYSPTLVIGMVKDSLAKRKDGK